MATNYAERKYDRNDNGERSISINLDYKSIIFENFGESNREI